MTKRFYYNCPIKALFMMKEFGVEFDEKDYYCLIMDANDDLLNDDDFMIYVAKESEEIFDTKDNDLMLSNDGETFFVEDVDCEVGQTPDWEPELDKNPHSTEVKIIMRDNKHFIDCEVENE